MKYLWIALSILLTTSALAGPPVIWGPNKAQILPAQLCFQDATCLSTAAGSAGPTGATGATGTSGATGASGAAGPSTVADNVLTVQNASDATKQANFSLGGQTTGTELTIAPVITSNQSLAYQPLATAGGSGIPLVQDATTGYMLSSMPGVTSSIGASGARWQLGTIVANASQLGLWSFANANSIAGISTKTSRSGVIGTNAAVLAGQEYAAWTSAAGATNAGTMPLAGKFAFVADVVNANTVTSSWHLKLTNLAGVMADRVVVSSEGNVTIGGTFNAPRGVLALPSLQSTSDATTGVNLALGAGTSDKVSLVSGGGDYLIVDKNTGNGNPYIQTQAAVQMMDGAAGTPAIGFTNNGGLGLYRSASNEFSLSSSSTQRVSVGGANGTLTMFNGEAQGIQYSVPASGDTVTVLATTSVLIIDPATSLATLTIQLPDTPTPGYVLMIGCGTNGVVSLTVTPGSGQTADGLPTALTATTPFRYVYRSANTTWYRI